MARTAAPLTLLLLLSAKLSTASMPPDPPGAGSELPLQSPSPFSLELSEENGVLYGSIHNRTDKPRLLLANFSLQPATLLVRDERRQPITVANVASTRSQVAPRVFRKDYILLAPQQDQEVGRGAVTGNPVERFSIRFSDSLVNYLPKGRYYLSLLYTAKAQKCFDCTAAEAQRLSHAWAGVVRSPEISLELR